jgi:hypothetical protein
MGFLGFRIPELQDFPGFPVFRDPEPHPSLEEYVMSILNYISKTKYIAFNVFDFWLFSYLE